MEGQCYVIKIIIALKNSREVYYLFHRILSINCIIIVGQFSFMLKHIKSVRNFRP